VRLLNLLNAHVLLARLETLSEECGIRLIAVSQEDTELLSTVAPGQIRDPH
jgi:hypothetical protein